MRSRFAMAVANYADARWEANSAQSCRAVVVRRHLGTGERDPSRCPRIRAGPVGAAFDDVAGIKTLRELASKGTELRGASHYLQLLLDEQESP